MKDLQVGNKVILENGDTGVVFSVMDNGYEFLMDSSGKYHHSYKDGSPAMFLPGVDVKSTEMANFV